MDSTDMAKMTDTWAKYWTVKTSVKEGRIKAVNQASASAQFKWLVENADCFCRTCVDTMNKKYSLYMDWSDKTCSRESPQVISGFMQG
jgi:hypothetical protein